MTLSSILIGIAIVTACSVFYVAGLFHGSRRTEVARKSRPMEIKDMAEKIGADLDFLNLGKTHEGSRLLDAMVQCEDCQSTDACHHFLDAESEPANRLATFCPNAVFLLGVTEGRRQVPIPAQGI